MSRRRGVPLVAVGTLAGASGSNFVRIFGAPVLLALISAIGLLSALLGDDLWDVLSWVALATLVAVIVWCVARAGRRT
jgi:hypothetical protein